MSHTDKFIFVSGAASGIGQATAIAYAAANAAGVCLIDINGAQLSETEAMARTVATHPNFQTLARVVDVTDEAAVDGVINDAARQFGRLDCAVNAAGVGRYIGPLAESTTADFDSISAVNERGLFFALRAQLRVMAAQPRRTAERGAPRGAIVNISSATGLIGLPGVSAYVASKHAVIGQTKAAAADHGKDGIRVNAVCPGFIATPMSKDFLQAQEEAAKTRGWPIPLERVGAAAECAEPILFLTSEAASFITAETLSVDAGYTAVRCQ